MKFISFRFRGVLLIAEVASRFVKVKDFVIRVEKLGFQAIEKVTMERNPANEFCVCISFKG